MIIDLKEKKKQHGPRETLVAPTPPQVSQSDPTPMPPRPSGFYARTGYRPTKGRPLYLTEDLIEAFRQVLPTVVYLETAGDLMHVHRSTWTKWVQEGRREDLRLLDPSAVPDPARDLHRRFFLMFKEAMAMASERNLNNIVQASDKWWAAAAWLESRRNPQRWGDQAREIAELKATLAETQKAVDRLVAMLPPDVLAAAGLLAGPSTTTTPPTGHVPAEETVVL